MTKPDDIPQDVWDAAAECLAAGDWPLWLVDGERHAAHISIARAILAERTRQESLVNLLQKDRERMSQDWCDFCETIGVDIDTHEAVAAQIKAAFDP